MKIITIFFMATILTACSTGYKPLTPEQLDQLKEAYPKVVYQPRYPIYAARNNIEGYVKFVFDVKEDGSVDNIKIIESSPVGVFDEVSKESIIKWKFKPAIVDGKRVRQKNMVYTMEYALAQ